MLSFNVPCSRNREIVLDTGTHILIRNTSILEEDLNASLENFLTYVQNGTINKSDDLIVDLDSAVVEAIHDEEWVSTMNRLEWEIKRAENRGREEALEKGRQEGLEQGIVQGLEQGRIQEIRALVADDILTEQQAAERIKCIQEQSDKM